MEAGGILTPDVAAGLGLLAGLLAVLPVCYIFLKRDLLRMEQEAHDRYQVWLAAYLGVRHRGRAPACPPPVHDWKREGF